MTTREAFKIAMSNTEFQAHHKAVKNAEKQYMVFPLAAKKTRCLHFWIDGEAFYYGFDGCETQLGKHSKSFTQHVDPNEYGIIIR